MDVKEIVKQAYFKGKLNGLSYPQIEKKYDIEPSSRPGDRVRGWINSFKSSSDIDIRDITLKTTNLSDTKVSNKTKNGLGCSGGVSGVKNLTLRRTWQAQTKDGIEWLESYQNNVKPEDIKKFRDELIRDLPSFPKRHFKHEPNKYGVLGVISLPDFHIGREEHITYNDAYYNAIESLLQKSSHHILDEIVFVIGNDYFNSDFDYKTTKGTPQFDYQKWKETWSNGRDILVNSIELLKERKCKINIINIPGNHDGFKQFALGDVIQAYYRNDDQVIVDNSDRLIKAFQYGNILLGFEHGEFKREEYESILANEFPELWGKSKYREFLCGHLHAEIVKEFRGIKLRHLPSLAKESDWEKSQGYKHVRQAQMLVYSKNKLESIYIE